MTQVDYQAFYNRVGKHNGWDFSKLKVIVEGNKQELFDEVAKRSKATDRLLDIGTGGGELLLTLSKHVQYAVGIDQSFAMIETARKNLAHSTVNNVEFIEMDAAHLQLLPDSFDIVTCRQAPFNANEIQKVLKPSGIFMTQQVCEHDKQNLKQAFGRGQNYDVNINTYKNIQLAQLKSAGFNSFEVIDYNVTEFYQTPEDLIFLLKHTPIIEYFGDGDKDFEILKRFIDENTTEKGIKTNSARYIIVAQC